MAQYQGVGGGGSSSAYGKGSSTYSSQVPHFNQPAKVSKPKKKAAVKAPKSNRSPVQSHQVVRATPRSTAGSNYAASRNGNGNRGGYSSGSSGVGSSSTGAVVPKAPTIPSPTDYLKMDSTYQGQNAALAKALKDYTAQQNVARTGYETNYASDLNSWNTNSAAAHSDLENDYASRGLLQSGLYADALTNTDNDWNQRKGQLELARQQYLQGLTGDLTNFTEQQTLTRQQAEQEAAARRAAKFGI